MKENLYGDLTEETLSEFSDFMEKYAKKLQASTTQELRCYTDDELREELKRRAVERRKDTPREIIYVEFEATIKEIDNIFMADYYGKGLHKYKAFSLWKYVIEDWTLDCPNANQILIGRRLELKQGLFKRDDSPQVGDRVKLRYRRTKGCESFDIWKTKIVEIVK